MWGTFRSRIAVAGVAAALVAVSAAAIGPANAATPKISVAGTVQCTATGKVTFSPALTATPRVNTKIKVTAKLVCSQGTTAKPGVTVTSGKISLTGDKGTFSCNTTNFGGGKGTLSWKGTGGSVPSSKTSFTSSAVTDGGTTVTLDIDGPGAISTGSYHNEPFKIHIVSDAVTGGVCGSAFKGFKFTAVGPSTLSLKPANPNNLPIDHIVVLMQENRSADHYLGRLNAYGQTDYEAEPNTGNPDPTNPLNPPILPFHKTSLCEGQGDLSHSWNGTHAEVNNGAMDGFTAANVNGADPTGSRTMGYYDETDLPFYYALYDTFATGDRYFSSLQSQTFPNRLYLLAGTSFGYIRNDSHNLDERSIFNLLDENSITWKIYSSQAPIAYGEMFFTYVDDRAASHVFGIGQYNVDLANNALPDVSFIDPDLFDPTAQNDEHPPANVSLGQEFVASQLNKLMNSSSWATSAFFLLYDEHGGYYDHVTPPAAVPPDAIPPRFLPGDTPGAFDEYGVRVPYAVVSPYSKPNYVSHDVFDHTSVLRFIEYRFGLPSLTARDAAANPMLDNFDFNTATFATPPTLPAAVISPC